MRSHPSLSQAFGRVLAEQRKLKGLSQERLASKSGLHRTYISQLERGLKSPSLNTLEALASVLGAAPHILLEAAEQLQASRRL